MPLASFYIPQKHQTPTVFHVFRVYRKIPVVQNWLDSKVAWILLLLYFLDQEFFTMALSNDTTNIAQSFHEWRC